MAVRLEVYGEGIRAQPYLRGERYGTELLDRAIGGGVGGGGGGMCVVGIEDQEEEGEEVGGRDEVGVTWWVDGRQGARPRPRRRAPHPFVARLSSLPR